MKRTAIKLPRGVRANPQDYYDSLSRKQRRKRARRQQKAFVAGFTEAFRSQIGDLIDRSTVFALVKNNREWPA
jgi:hypothetical protein